MTVREAYDAVVKLGQHTPEPTAYALVKRTYQLVAGRCVLVTPQPLAGDFESESEPDGPRIVPGSDLWPFRAKTDFIVKGSAFAPDGRATDQMVISARIGEIERRIAVFGRRRVGWGRDGSPFMPEPEPFERMPITYANAYGGVDRRVRPAEAVAPAKILWAALGFDHPGMYPRNAQGKGYVVVAEPCPLELPNLEDPTDLLSADRLVVRDPRLWYRQPLPACFDATRVDSFPRFSWFYGARPWYPAPEDEELLEVRRGLLPGGYGDRSDILDERFNQDGSGTFVLSAKGDEDVTVSGMHPTRAVEVHLPGDAPVIRFKVDGRKTEAEPRLHSILVEPDAERVCMVWGAQVSLPRRFIPGVHRKIPVEVSIDGDSPVEYLPPPTLRDMLQPKGLW